jgi:hypothetical protein
VSFDARTRWQVVDCSAAKREALIGLAESCVENVGELIGVAAHDDVDVASRSRAVTETQLHRHATLGRKHALTVRIGHSRQRTASIIAAIRRFRRATG